MYDIEDDSKKPEKVVSEADFSFEEIIKREDDRLEEEFD